MESKKIPKKSYLMPAVIMIAAVIIAIVLRNPALSIIVLAAGAALAFWAASTGFKNGMEKEVKAAAESQGGSRSGPGRAAQKAEGRDRHGG